MNALHNAPVSTRITWLRAATVAGVAAMLVLAAPLIWTAVSAGIGLLALGAILAAGFALVQSLPLLGQWLENRLLAARKAQARRNPIEQMQNHLLYRATQINGFRKALAAIYAQIEGMRDMLAERRRAAAHHDLSKQEAAVQKMTVFYASHAHKLAAAEAALGEYRQHVEMKVFEWEFAQQGGIILAQLNATDQERILRDLLADEASQSVQRQFNQVFAELDMEVRTLGNADHIDFGGGLAVDMSAVRHADLHVLEQRP